MDSQLVIGMTPYIGGIHAAHYETIDRGFAQALCRSTLWVLVDHQGNEPVRAVTETEGYGNHQDVPSCKLCVAKLEKLAA